MKATDHPILVFAEIARALWSSLYGKLTGASWKANPLVVAMTFRPELRNIDAGGA